MSADQNEHRRTILTELVEPSGTAVLTMELQRGVCGDLAAMPSITQAVSDSGVVAATAALLKEARQRGVPVVHCTFSLLADRSGTPMNTRMMQTFSARDPDYMLHGGPAAELIPELGRHPNDVESNRHHGFSPFTGTGLDAIFRERNVTTVIVTGMSLNLGIPGTVIEAVGLGYRTVVPRDCVAGVPSDFGELIVKQTLALISTITTSEQIVDCWH